MEVQIRSSIRILLGPRQGLWTSIGPGKRWACTLACLTSRYLAWWPCSLGLQVLPLETLGRRILDRAQRPDFLTPP
jgi:hypothetical protein